MILPLFISLLILGAFLVWLGYNTGDTAYAFVGLFFIFILGLYILTNQLEYETGVQVFTNTTTNVTSIDYQYTPYNDGYTRSFGLLLAFVAGAGMWIAFYNHKWGME